MSSISISGQTLRRLTDGIEFADRDIASFFCSGCEDTWIHGGELISLLESLREAAICEPKEDVYGGLIDLLSKIRGEAEEI